MRIYEGSARQDFEEVLRSIGAFLDQHGFREVLLSEVPDGFIVQALVASVGRGRGWPEPGGQLEKETLTFLDDDISRFMDEAIARRNAGAPQPDGVAAGAYEKSLRVIGRYIDQQKPRDVFFFEQDGNFVLRLLVDARARTGHTLVEFTREELEAMIQQGPGWRGAPAPRAGMGGLFAPRSGG